MTEQTFTTDLGDGYTLRSIHAPGSVRARAMGSARAFGDDAFMTELADAGLRPGKEITLPPAPVTRTRDLIEGAGLAVPPEATLSVAVGEDESCVLLVEDSATGAVSWIIADNASEGRDSSGARGLATTLHFTIPQAAAVPVDGAQRARGFGEIGKKIQSFLFKVTDPLLGPIIHGFARKWETKNRPTFVRAFGPDDYQNDDPGFPRLDEAGWQEARQGPRPAVRAWNVQYLRRVRVACAGGDGGTVPPLRRADLCIQPSDDDRRSARQRAGVPQLGAGLRQARRRYRLSQSRRAGRAADRVAG